MSDKDKVWPTGLTEAESEEIHRHLIQGTQIWARVVARNVAGTPAPKRSAKRSVVTSARPPSPG